LGIYLEVERENFSDWIQKRLIERDK